MKIFLIGPPTLTAPPSLNVTESVTLNYGFLASDSDSGQTIQVTVSGAAFASVSQVSGSSYIEMDSRRVS